MCLDQKKEQIRKYINRQIVEIRKRGVKLLNCPTDFSAAVDLVGNMGNRNLTDKDVVVEYIEKNLSFDDLMFVGFCSMLGQKMIAFDDVENLTEDEVERVVSRFQEDDDQDEDFFTLD